MKAEITITKSDENRVETTIKAQSEQDLFECLAFTVKNISKTFDRTPSMLLMEIARYIDILEGVENLVENVENISDN